MMTRAPEKPGTALLFRPRMLRVEDLNDMPIPIRIEDGFMVLDKGYRGWSFKQPVKVPLEKVLAAGEKGLVAYILRAFSTERPRLIPLVFENQSLVKLARHFLRYCSGSSASLYAYADDVSRYSRFLGHSPDMIINDIMAGDNIPDLMKVQNHVGFVEDYLAALQDDGLSPGRVHGAIKHVRSWYRVNRVKIELEESPSRKVTSKDRAPTPEELTRLLEICNLREKVIVSTMALGGFREGTLSLLQYGHVKEDLERGASVIHIHVDADETKGKYADYDTFLGGEAVEYLRSYLKDREKGYPGRKDARPPEELNDNSPLIRDETSNTPRFIGPKQIRKLVHNLYVRAGLVKPPKGRMYELRVHSLRKFYKTQLVAAGVKESYVDYFMGHKVDTYHDIQSLGVEKLRDIYAAASLSIRPKTKLNKIEMVKQMIRALGMNPDQVLTREAQSSAAATEVNGQDADDYRLQALTRTLGDLLRQAQQEGIRGTAP